MLLHSCRRHFSEICIHSALPPMATWSFAFRKQEACINDGYFLMRMSPSILTLRETNTNKSKVLKWILPQIKDNYQQLLVLHFLPFSISIPMLQLHWASCLNTASLSSAGTLYLLFPEPGLPFLQMFACFVPSLHSFRPLLKCPHFKEVFPKHFF